ncbi:hypothetical protein BDZ97DRAFT_1068143 [Flammula alnicola]|nr:hypothetical protein BDZ97DRAFT_1068143 [Flammula alnicola]
MLTHPDYEYPEEKRIREVAKRTGAKSTTTEIDPKAPLKPALKKTSSLKPTHKPALKSALKKESAYYSEGESQRRKDDRMKPPRVIQTPSKAFLEEQQEKLEQMHGRGWSSHHHPSQARPMHEIRPSAFIHTNSSSTGSPTDSMLAAHDPRVRSRRSSFVEPPPVMSSSNYMPAYIKEDLCEAAMHISIGAW